MEFIAKLKAALVLQPHIHEISLNSAILTVPYRLKNSVTMQLQKRSRSKCGCSIRVHCL